MNAIEIYTPGTMRLHRPVDPSTTVTITVKCRKNSSYVVSGAAGLSQERSYLPRLEIIREDGKLVQDTMADVTDSWDTLSAVVPIVARGVLVIDLIAEGGLGDNLLFVEPSRRPNIDGPKCWWDDLTVAVS